MRGFKVCNMMDGWCFSFLHIKKTYQEIRTLFISNSGTAAVEFALVIIPFLALFLFTAELCRIIFLSSVIDVTLAESSRYASYSGEDTQYETVFRSMLRDNLADWPLLGSGEDVDINVKYCANIQAILNDKCNSVSTQPLAIYSINYRYSSMFFIFPSYLTSQAVSRNVAFVQEYQRGAL